VTKGVLVVDDDQGLRETLEGLLQDEGYAVQLARDGVEALEQLAGFTPAVILLDIMMPRMDGYQFARQLEQRGLRSRSAIVVLTADGRARQKAEQVGAEAYVSKPFDVPDLLAQIERLAS
jgi:CheY-like chemotaxis protein